MATVIKTACAPQCVIRNGTAMAVIADNTRMNAKIVLTAVARMLSGNSRLGKMLSSELCIP